MLSFCNVVWLLYLSTLCAKLDLLLSIFTGLYMQGTCFIVLTSAGLNSVLEKYDNAEHWRCSRMQCKDQPNPPVAASDVPHEETVKVRLCCCALPTLNGRDSGQSRRGTVMKSRRMDTSAVIRLHRLVTAEVSIPLSIHLKIGATGLLHRRVSPCIHRRSAHS